MFTSNILHRVQCESSNCCGGQLCFRRMPQINNVRGLSGIKATSKFEVNPTSGFQTIAFTGFVDEQTDGRTGPFNKYVLSFDGRIIRT